MVPRGAKRRWAESLKRIAQHSSGRLGVIIIGAILVFACAGPFLVSWRPNVIDTNQVLQGPNTHHLLGTDGIGRDQLARIIAAIPVALEVTVGSTVFAMVIGGIIGVVAGFVGGAVERLFMWCTDIFLAMPPLLMAIVVTGVFGSGLRNTLLAIGVIYMPRFVRIARAGARTLRDRPFVDAARLAGAPSRRILRRHVVPGVLPSIIVMTTLTLSSALLAASALSFLGLGLRPPHADLGNMLSESVSLMSVAPWLVIFPSIVLVLMVLGFNLLGDAVGDVLDPRLNTSEARAGM
jgi:peptide/nickel transport system permease protein